MDAGEALMCLFLLSIVASGVIRLLEAMDEWRRKKKGSEDG